MHIKYSFVIILLFILFFSCNDAEKWEPGNVRMTDVTHGGCNNLNKSDQAFKELVKLTGDDSFLKINHINVMFNCCLSRGLGAKIDLVSDTLFVEEFEVEPGICDCICPYDLSYQIESLAEQEYVLCYKRGDGEIFFCYNFVFTSDLELEIEVNAD